MRQPFFLSITIATVLFCMTSCGSCALSSVPFAASLMGEDTSELTIMSYNVQNLFDAVDDGTEYPQFDPGEGEWGIDDYYRKLKALSHIIRDIDGGRGPDVLVFQELEKPAVLETLVEEFIPDLGYRFCHVAYTEEQSVHVGMLSRVPVEEVFCHNPGTNNRAIMEVKLAPGTKNDRLPAITVFANHWKSRLGGVAETEFQRREAAALIAHRISDLDTQCLVCGDLNWDTDQLHNYGMIWELEEEIPALGPHGSLSPLYITRDASEVCSIASRNLLFDPWGTLAEDASALPSGSYNYKGDWEAIDHILMSMGFVGESIDEPVWKYEEFATVINPDYCSDTGIPIRYNPRSQKGCSDHLPIILRIKLTQAGDSGT